MDEILLNEILSEFRKDSISLKKKNKYKFGLLYYYFLYTTKFSGEKRLKKLKRLYRILSKWESAIEGKYFRYNTQEARLNPEYGKIIKGNFDSELSSIVRALDFLGSKIKEFGSYQYYSGPL